MRFGRTLRNSIYEPWQSHYLDYAKLKHLLREDELDDEDPASSLGNRTKRWTEEDETCFVEELLNVQLEKVNAFHADTLKRLRERTSECETKLEKHSRLVGNDDEHKNGDQNGEPLGPVEDELDR